MFVGMSMETISLIRHLAVVVSALFALVACLLVPRWWSSPLRWVLVPLFVAFLLETTGTYTARLGINNTLLYNLFQPFEFVMLLLFIHQLRPEWRRKLLAAGALGLAVWVVSWNLNEPTEFLLTEAIVFTALLLTTASLGALWQLAERCEVPLLREPLFWLLLGLLAYFGGLFPIIGPLKFLESTSPMLAFNLYLTITVLSVLRFLLTGTACLLERRRLMNTRPA
jgi:hypothetical protein